MIKRILLDIDDVCNECSKYALQWLGVPFDYDNFYEKYPTELGYQIVEVANRALGYKRFDVPGFWNMIPQQFWATCPATAEFTKIFDRCCQLVGWQNVCFLTGPTKDPGCLAGKLEWIQKNAPPSMHRQYIISPRKHFCAHPEALLIDDNPRNIADFKAWGGHGILVPRPWNENHGINVLDHVLSSLDSYERVNQCVTRSC